MLLKENYLIFSKVNILNAIERKLPDFKSIVRDEKINIIIDNEKESLQALFSYFNKFQNFLNFSNLSARPFVPPFTLFDTFVTISSVEPKSQIDQSFVELKK